MAGRSPEGHPMEKGTGMMPGKDEGSDQEGSCPRCGTPVAGPGSCVECGLKLVKRPQQEPNPTQPG